MIRRVSRLPPLHYEAHSEEPHRRVARRLFAQIQKPQLMPLVSPRDSRSKGTWLPAVLKLL
jgi:hypothetical protein